MNEGEKEKKREEIEGDFLPRKRKLSRKKPPSRLLDKLPLYFLGFSHQTPNPSPLHSRSQTRSGAIIAEEGSIWRYEDKLKRKTRPGRRRDVFYVDVLSQVRFFGLFHVVMTKGRKKTFHICIGPGRAGHSSVILSFQTCSCGYESSSRCVHLLFTLLKVLRLSESDIQQYEEKVDVIKTVSKQRGYI